MVKLIPVIVVGIEVDRRTFRAAATRAVGPCQGRTGALGGLHAHLDHAELDTYEIWEVRRAWRGSVAQLDALNRTMEVLRQNLHGISGIDARRCIRSLPALGAELDARLAELEKQVTSPRFQLEQEFRKL